MAVSDPESPRYGMHWTRQEAADFATVPGAAIAAKEALLAAGATSVRVSRYSEYVIAKAPVSVWEKVFSTNFYVINRIDSSLASIKPVIRALEYFMPEELAPHAEAVLNTCQMPPPQLFRKRPEASPATGSSPLSFSAASTTTSPLTSGNTAGAAARMRLQDHLDSLSLAEVAPDTIYANNSAVYGNVIPEVIRDAYGIPSNRIGVAEATQAVYESVLQNYSPSDLDLFQSLFGTLHTQPVAIGGQDNDTVCANPLTSGNCGEDNLDVQYIMGVAQNVTTYVIYQFNETDASDDWMIVFLTYLMDAEVTPMVNSVSYGEPEQTRSSSQTKGFDTLAMKLGLHGSSIFIASGDGGAVENAYAFASNPYGPFGLSVCYYQADFPSSSPYVTAVGATMGPESQFEESVCQANANALITGGGNQKNTNKFSQHTFTHHTSHIRKQ